MDEDKKQELKKEILLGFHTQFAENQRTREQSFLKILSYLGAIIIGYAFVYHKSAEYSHNELSLVAILSVALLFFGSLVILTIAYNYRRDQIINAKIKGYVDVIGDKNIFPINYDPRKSKSLKKWYSWIPDFLLVFFCLFPIVQIILLISYILKLEFNFINIHWLSTFTVIFGIISFMGMIFFYALYFRKIKKCIKDNP